MKHAVLILAHKNVEQVSRLVAALKSENLDIFIHFDKKMMVTNEEYSKIKEKNKNVYFSKQRVSCMLDTWSLVEATYYLLKLAKSTSNYNYYLLLSGQDYPIKSVNIILNYLEEQYPKPLIDCTPYDKNNWIAPGFSRCRNISMHNLVNKMTKRKWLKKLLLIPVYCYEILTTMFYGRPINILKKAGCDLYGGSAWWVLPDECINLIISEIEEETEIIKAFRRKTTPEETFFQTMVMRSNLAYLVEVNDINCVAQNCPTFAYFQDVDKPPTGHPYIFKIENYKKICDLPNMFARKFDQDVDAEILDAIDKNLL